MLELFNLSKWAKAPVMSLSGGMAQRLMVARAILHRPAVLFLDEPTAGLDPQSRIAMWDIVGRLHDDGQTIFLTTHYMEEADELCDRVAIMDHGRILALDTPEGLKASTGADTVVVVIVEGHVDGFVARLRDGIDGIAALDIDEGRRAPATARHGWARPGDRRRSGRRRRQPARHLDQQADPRDRLHQPHRQGAARLMTATVTPSAPSAPAPIASHATRSTFHAGRAALWGLMLRDLTVLRKSMREFIPRTILQPFLLCFVFLYVFPKIGQGVGGGGGAAGQSTFATILVAGVVGLSINFQGIQAVALPLVQEIGYTKEIEDRALAPAAGVAGRGCQGALGSDPRARRRAHRVPDRRRRAHRRHPRPPLVPLVGAAHPRPAGLRGVRGDGPHVRHVLQPAHGADAVRRGRAADDVPRRHLLPVDSAGGVKVGGFAWLQTLVLVNPLIYITEGFRAALTTSTHMHLYVVYPVLIGFTVFFLWLGIPGFKKRVLS